MIPYVILFCLILLLAIPFNDRRIKGYSKFFIIITLIFLSLFSGLASSRGDYLSYKDIFNTPFDNSAVEKGFQILNYCIKTVGGGYHLLLILVAFIAVSFKLAAFKKLTPFLGLATIIYVGNFFVPADMGSIRFGIAMGVFLFSLQYAKEHQFWKFAFVILLGCTFHGSLIIAILLYLMYSRNLEVKHYIIILVISVVSYFFFDIGKFVGFTQGIVPNEYNVFLKALSYLDMKASLNFAIIKRIIILGIATVFYAKLDKVSPYFKLIYDAYFLSIVTFLAFSLSFYLANRTSWLFASVEPILLSYFLKISDNNIIKSLILIGIVVYSLVNMCYILITQTEPPFNLYLPYKLFFE